MVYVFKFQDGDVCNIEDVRVDDSAASSTSANSSNPPPTSPSNNETSTETENEACSTNGYFCSKALEEDYIPAA